MSVRKILAVMAAYAMAATTPVSAAISGPEHTQAVAGLGRGVLSAMAATPAGDKDAVLAAINRATQGADLRVISEVLCQLRARRDLPGLVGTDPAALTQAQTTLARPEVIDALGDTCEIANLALASYGATGGVPAGGAPGQAFGSGGVGAPGGGGGSGYTN